MSDELQELIELLREANVRYLKAEGGVEGLRQRFKESDDE